VTFPRPFALAATLLLAGCGAGTATLQASAPVTTQDLAPLRSVHADHVLVAGDGIVLTTATGTVRVKVNGPALQPLKAPGVLHHYLATFTVTVTPVSGTVTVTPADFSLLAIADQVDGGGIVTQEAAAAKLVNGTGTWSAPFVEGHGEFLFTPRGASRPAALWDFRAES
jgi:hypothetical protein